MHLCVVTSRMWDTLCAALDRPDLATDPRFDTQALRREHRSALYDEIVSWTRERTKYEAMNALAPLGVALHGGAVDARPCGRTRTSRSAA